MLYHAGKVYAVLSGNETHVTVEMWDDNVFTFDVDEDLVNQLETGDVVLIDYTPVEAGDNAVPRHKIVKVLGDEEGKRVWKRYRQFNNEQRNNQSSVVQPSYMG